MSRISEAIQLVSARCEAADATGFEQGVTGYGFQEIPHGADALGRQRRHLSFEVEARRTEYLERRRGSTRASTRVVVILNYRIRPTHGDEPKTDKLLALDAAEVLVAAVCSAGAGSTGDSSDMTPHPVTIDPLGTSEDGKMMAVQIEINVVQTLDL